MTHGEVFLPVNEKILNCKSYAHGYLNVLGLELLCSSNHIEAISRLTSIFLSPFIYSNNQFFSSDSNFLTHTYLDEKTYKDAKNALHLVMENKLEDVYKSNFASLKLEDKIAMFGNESAIYSQEAAWQSFTEYSHILPERDIAQLLVVLYKENNKFQVCANYRYFWKDDQFFLNVYIEEKKYLIPLIFACAINCDADLTIGNLDYLYNMTEKDKKSFYILLSVLQEQEISHNVLFKGTAKNILDKIVLEKTLQEELTCNNDKKASYKI